jgi:hypothetical protein
MWSLRFSIEIFEQRTHSKVIWENWGSLWKVELLGTKDAMLSYERALSPAMKREAVSSQHPNATTCERIHPKKAER